MFRTNRVVLGTMVVLIIGVLSAPTGAQEPVRHLPEDAPRAISTGPSAFIPVAIKRVAVDGPPVVVVDMARVPVSPESTKSLSAPGVHIQGEYAQGQSVPPALLKAEATRRGEPTVELDPEQFPSNIGGPLKVSGQEVIGFEGIPAEGFIPPDTVMAVGPEYIVEAVNVGFNVFTKTGIQTRAHTRFADFVNIPAGWNGGFTDPRVVYDVESGKFLMLILGIDGNPRQSFFWIMVSQTSDPNGAWWLYRYDTTTGPVGEEQWLDFASLGVDHWGVYVVGNSFGFNKGSGFQEAQLWTLNRAMLDGGAADGIFWPDLRWPNGDLAFSLQVAHPHTLADGQRTIFINNYPASGTQVCLWTYTGERWFGQGIGDATLTRAAIDARVYYGIFNNVDQPGSDWDIDGGDCRIGNAIYSHGTVYTTFGLDWNAGREYSEVYVAAFDSIAATKEWDYAIWHPDYFMFFPAITIEGSELNPDWMVAMSMTVPDDPLGFAGTFVVTHDPSTDTGTWTWDRLGLGPYSIWDSEGFVEGLGRNRWGDYSMAAYDWWCENAWGAAEYATLGNSYATRIFARTLGDAPLCRYVHVVNPNFGGTFLAGSTVNLLWSKMNIPTVDEMWVTFDDGSGTTAYGPLASGATSFLWTVPNVQTTNARIIVGAWDPVGATWHATDDSDTTFAVTGLPDLTAPFLDPPKTTLYPGEGMDVYNSLVNSAPVSSGPFDVEIGWSPDTTCTVDDVTLERRTVVNVAAGALDFSTTRVTIPAGTVAGIHYLCLLIDPYGAVSEFNETNNTTYREITILDPSLFADGFEGGSVAAWSSHTP